MKGARVKRGIGIEIFLLMGVILLIVILLIAGIFLYRHLTTKYSLDDVLPLRDKIAFEEGGNTYLMDPDGKNKELFIEYGGKLALSRDGKMVAFVRGYYVMGGDNPRATRAIYIMTVDRKGFRQITSEGFNEYPSWSPDGKKIAFASDPSREFVLSDEFDKIEWNIYVVDIETKEITRLTEDGGFYPAWSPDEERIAFIHLSSDRKFQSIRIMDADGANVVELISVELDMSSDTKLSWSPCGEKIAFSAWYCQRQIFVINDDGTDLKHLTATMDAQNASPSWSPDGKKIAFASTRDGGWSIYLMDSDGSNVVRITGGLDFQSRPAWSPLGPEL